MLRRTGHLTCSLVGVRRRETDSVELYGVVRSFSKGHSEGTGRPISSLIHLCVKFMRSLADIHRTYIVHVPSIVSRQMNAVSMRFFIVASRKRHTITLSRSRNISTSCSVPCIKTTNSNKYYYYYYIYIFGEYTNMLRDVVITSNNCGND